MVAPGGACMVARGGGCGCSGEHAWLLQGVCMVALGGGMHGCSQGGMCGCSRGHAWLLWGGSACMVAPGGHAWLLWGACMVALGGGMHGCYQGGMCGCSQGGCMVALGRGAWDMTRYGDTINERAVCILLECILVSNFIVSVHRFDWQSDRNMTTEFINFFMNCKQIIITTDR